MERQKAENFFLKNTQMKYIIISLTAIYLCYFVFLSRSYLDEIRDLNQEIFVLENECETFQNVNKTIFSQSKYETTLAPFLSKLQQKDNTLFVIITTSDYHNAEKNLDSILRIFRQEEAGTEIHFISDSSIVYIRKESEGLVVDRSFVESKPTPVIVFFNRAGKVRFEKQFSGFESNDELRLLRQHILRELNREYPHIQ